MLCISGIVGTVFCSSGYVKVNCNILPLHSCRANTLKEYISLTSAIMHEIISNDLDHSLMLKRSDCGQLEITILTQIGAPQNSQLLAPMTNTSGIMLKL